MGRAGQPAELAPAYVFFASAAAGPDPFGVPYRTAYFDIFLDHEGYPAIKPPWGTLNAIDLNTGEYRWKVVLGEYPELTAQGIAPKPGGPPMMRANDGGRPRP